MATLENVLGRWNPTWVRYKKLPDEEKGSDTEEALLANTDDTEVETPEATQGEQNVRVQNCFQRAAALVRGISGTICALSGATTLTGTILSICGMTPHGGAALLMVIGLIFLVSCAVYALSWAASQPTEAAPKVKAD